MRKFLTLSLSRRIGKESLDLDKPLLNTCRSIGSIERPMPIIFAFRMVMDQPLNLWFLSSVTRVILLSFQAHVTPHFLLTFTQSPRSSLALHKHHLKITLSRPLTVWRMLMSKLWLMDPSQKPFYCHSLTPLLVRWWAQNASWCASNGHTKKKFI